MEPDKQLTIREEVEKLAPQFKAALPPHISVEKFIRTAMTAINADPELVQADRRSLFEATMRCAQDGLLPDKREAAFVVFNANTAKNGAPAVWIKKVVYIAMVAGLLKKIRNSGELASIAAHVVFENDDFSYELGDSEKIHHAPLLKGARGVPILAYAIATMKDGAVYREIMTHDEIEVTRNFSKAKDGGPWAGPFYLEMWRKTVLRRLSKRLPMSTDIERDSDELEIDEPRESSAATRLRIALTEHCQRNGGGSPYEMLRNLVGHDSFAELTIEEAERGQADFERHYLGAEAKMD